MGTSEKSAKGSNANVTNSKKEAIYSIIDKFIEESEKIEKNKDEVKSESNSSSQSKSVSFHSAGHKSKSYNKVPRSKAKGSAYRSAVGS